MVPSPAMMIPCPQFIALIPFPGNRFPNKLVSNVPNNMLKNPPFHYFASISIVSPTPFINKPDSSKDFQDILFSWYLPFLPLKLSILWFLNQDVFMRTFICCCCCCCCCCCEFLIIDLMIYFEQMYTNYWILLVIIVYNITMN